MMKRICSLLLLAALILVPAQQARADFPSDTSGNRPPPWHLPEEGEDTSGQSDTESLPGQEECIDWDVLMGLQCNNDYPPGETAPGPEHGGTENTGPGDTGTDDTGPDDTGTEDTGPNGTVESCEPNCEIFQTDDGDIGIWVDEPGGDTGGTGDTGALGSTAAEESQEAYQVFAQIAIGSQIRLSKVVDSTVISTTFKVVDMATIPTQPAHYQVLLHRGESTLPVPEWINFTITQQQTVLRYYLTPPKLN
jgi:hypothetical protein